MFLVCILLLDFFLFVEYNLKKGRMVTIDIPLLHNADYVVFSKQLIPIARSYGGVLFQMS